MYQMYLFIKFILRYAFYHTFALHFCFVTPLNFEYSVVYKPLLSVAGALRANQVFPRDHHHRLQCVSLLPPSLVQDSQLVRRFTPSFLCFSHFSFLSFAHTCSLCSPAVEPLSLHADVSCAFIYSTHGCITRSRNLCLCPTSFTISAAEVTRTILDYR